jgi:two-component system cell cycle sensor histidine kinase/response regulator CckA
VLMDIVLKGEMDGVEAAAQIRKRWAIPIIYLTAYTDDATLKRARVTEPFGYIVKPFSERELRANIEMALYKHQVETKLRAIEKWFATSMQHIGDGIITTDAQGTITFMNQVAEVLSGWKSNEAIGRGLNETVSLVSSDRTSLLAPLLPSVTESGPTVEVEGDVILVNQRRNESIPIYLAVTSLRDPNGDAIGAVMVMRGLSDQKRAAQLLRETEERYLQAQKLEAVGLLAGGMAHEFNNLLTVISGYTGILLNKPQMDEAAREHLKGIQEAGQRASQLTRRLLGFSRKQVLESRVVDLNTLVADMGNMLGRLIGEDIILTTTLAQMLGRVKVDPGQMEQVIMNLVVNACDAMPGGGNLSIETANIGLKESLNWEGPELSPGHYVRLTVKDTGCGMSPEVKARIFEPFFTTKNPGSGTGLGLATVCGIVQQSGGHITVESEPGKGATFNIYLPVVEEKILLSEINPGPIPAWPAQETVLAVEDEDLVRGCILHILRGQGYTVLEANGPEEAIRLCEDYEGLIHLLVTDVVMPGMGGGRMAERVTELHPGMKVLYISGYPEDTVVRHGVQETHARFLQKPFTPDTLAHKVRGVLDDGW